MEQAVRLFQQRVVLMVDGIICRNTLRTLNAPVETRLAQLKINLERHRWMPRKLGQRYVLINLANYRLQAFENGVERLGMKVVICKKDRQTPSFHSQMSRMVFNPFLNVPIKLARLDLLPIKNKIKIIFSSKRFVFSQKLGTIKSSLIPLISIGKSMTRTFPYFILSSLGSFSLAVRHKPFSHRFFNKATLFSIICYGL